MFAIITRWRIPVLIALSLIASQQLGTIISQALKVRAHIPELVKLNDAFWLNCSHHHHHHWNQPHRFRSLEAFSTRDDSSSSNKEWDDIYAIKWYKDDEEFYRFLPNGQPKVSIYETNGIQLDQTKSHEGNVHVSKADVNSEGNYRCEILSEAPVFETVRKSKQLKVYALPVRGPRIEILDPQGRPKSPKAQEISYAVGDKIELRCNSAPSKPAAKLRWYLNEHEITIPQQANGTTPGLLQTSGSQGALDLSANRAVGGYEVKVTPIEFRQHYKSIYSSHSTLSLVLQQDDLINNKISFKCLASMRQEVPLRSKQLIVLMPPLSSSSGSSSSSSSLASASSRSRREIQILPATDSTSASPSNQRQRPQNQRHSVTRLQQHPDGRPKLINNSNNNNLVFDDNEQRSSKRQMFYIYEEANSALGSTIIDTLESLESYLANSSSPTAASNDGSGSDLFEGATRAKDSSTNYALEFSRATDNLEYIELLRERSSPGRQHRLGQAIQQTSRQRLHGAGGANSLIRSPFYLDEHDPLRPIISWPPLESGKLQLMGPPSHPIVAIPVSGAERLQPIMRQQSEGNSDTDEQQPDLEQLRRIMLEKLLRNINCTCTDGSIDTRLSWVVNDNPLDTRDTRYYPTRVSADHRQTILTIGMLNLASSNNPAALTMPFDSPPSARSPLNLASASSQRTLKSLLSGYLGRYKLPAEVAQLSSASATAPSTTTSNDQIRFSCQAIHSVLLHSSSEMITFDFNPTPIEQTVPNSIADKFAASSSNVIQATSASQSSSASRLISSYGDRKIPGSQTIIFITLLATIFSSSVFFHRSRQTVLQRHDR